MPEPTITYTWRIEQLDVAPEEGGLADVVHTIHWRLLATDGDNTVDTYGSVPLGLPDPSDFTNYQDLAPEIVTAWLEEAIDSRAGEEDPSVAQLYDSLAGMLAAKRAPAITPRPVPWA